VNRAFLAPDLQALTPFPEPALQVLPQNRVSRVLSIGGGPAGLYAALLLKKRNPALTATVLERNQPNDTFGWGVVFSDQTLENLRAADPSSAEEILQSFNHWDDIEVFFKGRSVRSTGHGFCGIGRKRLLNILQDHCRAAGVDLIFGSEVDDDHAAIAQHQPDLVIASDGLNSRIRSRYSDVFQPDIDTRKCRFVWLGTEKTFEAFTFAFEQTEHGWFQAHAYRFEPGLSTFIVETPESVWRAHGLDQMDQEGSIAFCEKLFARYLDGNALLSNARHLRGSAFWIQFPRVICKTWLHTVTVAGRAVPLVLMGDAAHTAHFSIGSGTKLALEDAIELNRAMAQAQSLSEALKRYQASRSVEVLKIQNAARNSTEWFENVSRYTGMEIEQFAYSLMTRSQRISHENLRLRDAPWLNGYEAWLAQKVQANQPGGARPSAPSAPSAASPSAPPPPPMLLPLTVRGCSLPARTVVSPMATYMAVDGVPQDFHLVHLGARALGGAGLVFVEMTSPTPEGRITPGCTGLWNDSQETVFARIVQFVHQQTPAKIGIQLGHSGPKGSTQLGWQEVDAPLPQGNWPLMAASAIAYGPQNQVPRAMNRADMNTLRDAFVETARRAVRAGFDWIELHCAHGYLLSSFLCPLTNLRTDDYGGSLENRCRYPLEVFRAIRLAIPEALPMSVRISAHDWAPGGNTDDDAVVMARLFKDAGADFIDVSSGQTTRQARPVYGRMYQTPFADRIRNEVGIRTIAVGAIFEADHVNSIIAAGRADLCAIARPHLANPAWTLHEAARLGSPHAHWPLPYLAGRDQLVRNAQRAAEMAAEDRQV